VVSNKNNNNTTNGEIPQVIEAKLPLQVEPSTPSASTPSNEWKEAFESVQSLQMDMMRLFQQQMVDMVQQLTTARSTPVLPPPVVTPLSQPQGGNTSHAFKPKDLKLYDGKSTPVKDWLFLAEQFFLANHIREVDKMPYACTRLWD
jgi:hypothetical protein